MSDYTTEVRYICESYSGLDKSKNYLSIDEILEKSCGKIFDFPFPIFDENYRKVLECKILKHYYTREIGAESVGLWKLFLNRRMNEIMPYYNQLYKSELIQFNPLYDVDVKRESNNTTNGEKSESETSNITDETTLHSTTSGQRNQSGSSSSENKNIVDGTKWDEYSDTPQGTVGNLDNRTYLTNARKNTDNTSNTSTGKATDTSNETNSQTSDGTNNSTRTVANSSSGSNNTTQKYLETVQGKRGGASNSKMLMEFRETFLNIDMQIINELENLFMLIW